jgi:acetolactate synthase-1/2/3 large subunit
VPTVADTLADALRRHGIDTIFGQSLPTMLILAAERAGIRQIVYRTENAGGAMADAYARTSGRVGVVAAQNGPAAVLLVAPLAEALKASVPVVALVQDIPRPTRERNAFQEFDHQGLFESCTKWVSELDDRTRVDDYVDLAFRHATAGRPGPVVLLLPKDLLAEPAPDDTRIRRESLGRFPLDRPRPDAATIRRSAELLAAAANPLVIAGGGVHLSDATGALVRLQEAGCLPVATTTMGKGTVDEAHPLSVGVVGSFMGQRSLTHSQRALIDAADVVLLAGTRTNENGTDSWSLLPDAATLIHLDIDGTEVGRNYEAIRLVGDARAGLQDLHAALAETNLSHRRGQRDTVTERIGAARRHDEAAATVVTTSDAAPIRPERVMAELDRLLTPDTIVVSDASYSSIWMPAYLHTRRAGQRFLAPRGLAGLGWGLPMALGAQAANRQSPVVCLTGDGGFAHCWSELETAIREDLPITLIVLNNAILGYQKHAELQQFGAHTTAIDIHRIDHTAIARACGAHAVRVEAADGLTAALTDALARDRATLIEVLSAPDALPPITEWDNSPALSPYTVAGQQRTNSSSGQQLWPAVRRGSRGG